MSFTLNPLLFTLSRDLRLPSHSGESQIQVGILDSCEIWLKNGVTDCPNLDFGDFCVKNALTQTSILVFCDSGLKIAVTEWPIGLRVVISA